jgi:two-component system, chemotaxis family, chemotaxis protein CheY
VTRGRLALVIDDSRVARMKLRKALQEQGFEVNEAGDGQAALAAIDGGFHPDIALVDWNMPGMNGLDFVKQVRKCNQQVVLLMVTSEAEPRQMVRALQAGANEYLIKPYTKEMLVEKLALLGVGGPSHG